MDHSYYMSEALKEAQKALEIDEVPIGAVVVYQGEIIGRGHNNRIHEHKPSGHAEINALEEAGRYLKTWNLSECSIYVTIEPCIMCAGAIMMARIQNVYYGAHEPRFGAYNSLLKINEINKLNHYANVNTGIYEIEAKDLMEKYFMNKRDNQIKVKKVETSSELEEHLSVRKQVFVQEQQVPEELEIDELDTLDSNVTLVNAYHHNEVVGTLRIIPKGKVTKIGRVATLKSKRRLGIGKKMMLYAIKQAKNNGTGYMELDAQLTAIPFYESLGFKAEGEIFLDAGIEHKKMKYLLIY